MISLIGSPVINGNATGAPVRMCDSRLARGFHKAERKEGREWRWTDGEGVLAIGKAAAPRPLRFRVMAMTEHSQAA